MDIVDVIEQDSQPPSRRLHNGQFGCRFWPKCGLTFAGANIHRHGEDGEGSFSIEFADVPDSPELTAFVAGTMPAKWFADWLEEVRPNFDRNVLDMLRLSDR